MIIHHEGRYFLAFHESTELEDIISYQNHLIELLKVASTADIFGSSHPVVFTMCRLLHELNLTQIQGSHLQRQKWEKAFDMSILEEVKPFAMYNR